MLYNITAEAVSGVFLLVVFVICRGSGKIPRSARSRTSRLFLWGVAVLLAAICTDCSASLLMAHLHVPLCRIAGTVYITITFVLINCMPLLYTAFLLSFLYKEWPGKRLYRTLHIVGIPSGLSMALVLLDPFTHWFFAIDASSYQCLPPLTVVTVCNVGFYCILTTVLAIRDGRRYTAEVRIGLFAFPAAAVCSVALQVLFPQLPLTATCMTVAYLYMYDSLNNWRTYGDELTGAFTRQVLQQHVRRCQHQDKPFFLVIISMDHFKHINRRYGSEYGDALLKIIASWLMVTYEGVYRFSGDGFALLLQNMPDFEQVQHAAEKIQDKFSAPWQIDGVSCVISVTIDIINSSEMPKNDSSFLQLAEAMALQSKADRRGQIVWCDMSMRRSIARHNEVVEALRRAVESDSITMALQPVYNAHTEKFALFEALARLNDPQLGSVSPAEFIPLAEEYHLVERVDLLMLQRVCELLQRTENDTVRPEGISVNFSPRLFALRDLQQRVDDIINRYEFTPSRLRIEIIESTISSNAERLLLFMRTMKDRGIRFYLDDFGTGFSNLARVTQLDVDVVKIDKSMLYEAEDNPYCGTLLEYLAQAFADHGCEIIWEGVETHQQAELVRGMSGNLMQGYLYAKPMPVEAALAMMQERTDYETAADTVAQ